ncbi:MAG: hypothetical protein E7351_02385 [Clostridiales bacterium]|nr:hypothetical protein [Clostridiales bacterium]
MKQRTITSVFIVLITLLVVISKFLPYSIGEYIFDIFVLFIVIVSGFEICNVLEKMNRRINKFLGTMYGVFNYLVLILCLNKFDFPVILCIEFAGLLAYFVIVLLVEYIKDSKAPFKQHFTTAANTILACMYPSFLLCLMLNINHIDYYAGVDNFSMAFLIMIFAITMLTDTFAYLVGSTLRGPKLAPKISPNKTISGAIGGLIGGVAGSMLVYLLVLKAPAFAGILDLHSLTWWHFLLIGLFGSIFGQIGDLFESKIKRNANIKDTGNLFPGHGGMLDRYDAMIFVATFVYIVISLILL